MDLKNHPCFNDKVRHLFARVHLPVAPKCNVQCNFCNRKFDCVNESRPGVSSAVLSPGQALAYLEKMMEKMPNISVVGIAGPGDPFANPDETMETLRRVRERYPEMLLCVATNECQPCDRYRQCGGSENRGADLFVDPGRKKTLPGGRRGKASSGNPERLDSGAD